MYQNIFGLYNWENPRQLEGIRYTCGYCGVHTSPNHGYATNRDGSNFGAIVAICTNCHRASYLFMNERNVLEQTPGPLLGEAIRHLPEDIDNLYGEAQRAIGANAHTASVLITRKILMHVAVEQGAEVGRNFLQYVEFLRDEGYIPPNGEGWVDYIRQRGNETNHEINIMNEGDSSGLLRFLIRLL